MVRLWFVGIGVVSILLGGMWLDTFVAEENPLAILDHLHVGLYAGDVTPPVGVPLAGFGGGARRIGFDILNRYPYATFLAPSEGILDPIRAKVMVLKQGKKKLVFISMDTVAVTADIRKDFLKQLEKKHGLGPDEVFISATHTHSGPGTLSRNLLWSLLAADAFQQKIYDQFINDVVRTVEKAFASLEPADLWAFEFKTSGIQRNRRGKEGYFDPLTNVLLAKNKKGHWLGGMVNVAVHGTSLSANNLRFSADIPGAMERAAQARLKEMNGTRTDRIPTVLFINGADGDVAPVKRGLENMLRLADSFADQFVTALTTARTVDPNWSVTSKEVKLSSASFNVRGCIKDKTIRSLIFKEFRLWIGFLLPSETQVWNIQLGDLTLMTWPGEATTSVGFALKHAANKVGVIHPWFMGLTNDYLGYYTTEEEYHSPTYEACSSLFGPDGTQQILYAHEKLLNE